MTALVASPGPVTLVGCTAIDVSHRDPAPPPATANHAAASAGGHADAGTPFYNHLMSMIDATALENRHAQQCREIDAVPPTDGHSWLTGHLIASAAVLVVVVAFGGIVAGLRAGQSEPPVVTADRAPAKKSLLVASATTAEAPAETALPAAKPDDSGSVGIKVTDAQAKDAAVDGIDAGSVSAAKADEPAQAKPADRPSVASVGSGVKAENEAPEGTPLSARTAPTEVSAPPEALPGKTLSENPPSKKSSAWIETGSIVESPAAIRNARMLSDANMRAGPGMSQAVVAAIPRGSAVEVLSCRHWCEVVFAGQRGWVYKDYIGASETTQGR
jgi:Bacterial SH3 domain